MVERRFMVQGIHRPDPNRSCLQVCHRSLTVSHSRVLGSSSSQAGVTGRTLTAGPGVEETCEKPVREGIHRPDPNPSCIQVSQRFLTAFSQPSLGDFQQPRRGLVPAFDCLRLRRLDQSCTAETHDPTCCDYICAGTGLSSARSGRI